MNVAADPEMLAEFVAVSGAVAGALGRGHDELADQRAGLVGRAVVAPPGRALPALGDVANRVTDLAAFVAEIRDLLLTADAWPGGPGTGPVELLPPEPDWTQADVERLVALGELRRRLRSDLMAGGVRYREAAADRMVEVEAEIDELALLLDRTGWRAVAHEEAGFDPDRWDPARGLTHNDANVRSVYNFYGQLHLDDPRLEWAGLAALVGRRLYANWQDLSGSRQLLTHADRMAYVERQLGLPSAPPWVHEYGGWALGIPYVVPEHDLNHNLKALETEFMSMVVEIFDDMGWMHMAHHYGGTTAVINELNRDDPGEQSLIDAWVAIGGGDDEFVQLGNRALAYREQKDIIGDNWDTIRRNHPVLTRLLVMVVENPVPGGRPFRDMLHTPMPAPSHLQPGVPFLPDLPFPESVPTGDVSVFDDRWQYFTEEVEPAFRRLLAEHPEVLHAILSSPFDADVGAQRISPIPYRADRSHPDD